jgi:SAM-dependent methyltransferase
MPGARETADVETSSDTYARRFSGAVGAWFLEVQARVTLDLVRAWPGATVIDVGGGHGQLTGPLVEAGYDVTVFGSAEVCRERVRDWVDAGHARFASGDLLRLPFPDASFDVAISYRLLPHVTLWPALVAELARVARRAVIVDYPTSRSVNVFSPLLFRLKKGMEKDTRPFTVFRDADLVAAFAARGFQATARRPQFFFPMAVHRAVGAIHVARALEAVARALGLVDAFGSPVILRLERSG